MSTWLGWSATIPEPNEESTSMTEVPVAGLRFILIFASCKDHTGQDHMQYGPCESFDFFMTACGPVPGKISMCLDPVFILYKKK